jgi:ferritin-like protein
MNPKDIRSSSDPDLAGSYAAMLRAARSAEDLAIKTNTSIIVSVDGKDVELTATDLIMLREQEEHQSHY